MIEDIKNVNIVDLEVAKKAVEDKLGRKVKTCEYRDGVITMTTVPEIDDLTISISFSLEDSEKEL